MPDNLPGERMKNSIGHRGLSVVMRPQYLPYPGSHQPFFSRRILDRGKPLI